MPDRWRPLRSVRARTTAVAVGAVAIALAFAAFGLIGLLRNRLVASIDQTAVNRASDVAALVSSGTLPDHFDVPGEGDSAVAVVDSNGSPLLGGDADLNGLPAVTADDDHPTVFDFTWLDHGRRSHMRVAALVVRTPTGDFTVYAAQTRDDADQTVAAIMLALLLGIPLMLTLVGILTWRSAGRALAPVSKITSQVALITDRELDRRVPVPASGDEITSLATTMNSMLGRVERAMSLQRQFTADASHELRSPLTSLRTQLDVAVLDPEPVTVTDAAPNLFAELDRLDRLVTDLIALARIDGRAHDFRPVDLIQLVRDEVHGRP